MKKFWLFIGIIMFCFLACACLPKSTTFDEIQFMTWGSSAELSIIKPIIEEYNKTHDTKVRLVHVPQNYFQKLHLLFASNLAPDVIFINNLYIKIYQKAGLLEDLTPIINENEYFKNALNTLSIDGKIYAVPRDVSSMVVFYNKKHFLNAGIKPDKNWDINMFYNAARILKTKYEYGFCTEFEPGYIENFISVENKPFFTNGKLTIKENASLNALQKLADAINKEKLSADKKQLTLTPCAQLFIQEKSPMFISGRWSVPKLDKQKNLEYAVLPFPKGVSNFYIPLNASGWAISKKSKNKTAAMDFIKYISSDENIRLLAKSGLITPAKKKAAFSDNFKNKEVFIDIIKTSTPNITPNDYNIITDKIKLALLSVLGGYKSAKTAFEEF